MAGWNGAGIFNLLYVFVQDAANGIKILASRQDGQWNLIKQGLELCQTRDGQNSPIADWNFDGFKITNLGAPVNPTDAARLEDVIAVPAGEWLTESNAFTFVNATSFKLTGADLTARYEIGRRLKITHNAGATTSYYTVTSRAFAAGDTTVNVSGPTLVTPLTAVSYALLDAANLAVPTPSVASIFINGGTGLSSGTDYVLGGSLQFPATTVTGDIYSEIAAGVFTAKYAGLYLVMANCSLAQVFPSTITAGRLSILKNGGALRANSAGVFVRFNQYAVPEANAVVMDIASLTAGDTLQVITSGLTYSSSVTNKAANVIFQRVR